MVHNCAYISGAAQHPRKKPSIEFFMMHSTNLSTFYQTFTSAEWLSLEQRARLLTWKGWMDMVLYAANGCPELHHERIAKYQPKAPGPFDSIIKRVNRYPDDGHTSKLIRALLHAYKLSSSSPRYHSNGDFPLRPEEFVQIAHMAMDSVERMLEPGYQIPEAARRLYVERLGVDEEVVKIVVRFVRWAGVEGAWDDFEDLEEQGGKARL